MKKQILVIAIIFLVLNNSCKKIFSSGNTYTLKGTLYLDCSKKTMANELVELKDNNTLLGKATTDANGKFEIGYQSDFLYGHDIYVGGSCALRNVPGAKNIDSLEVYWSPTCILNVKLNVNKGYSSSDTLQINDLITGVGNIKIAGPFMSGVVYSIPKFEVLNVYYYDDKHPITDSSEYVGYNFNQTVWQGKKFVPIPCKNIDVVIDVN